jgi:hypothetical protein
MDLSVGRCRGSSQLSYTRRYISLSRTIQFETGGCGCDNK